MPTVSPDPASTWGADAAYKNDWFSQYAGAGAYVAPIPDVLDDTYGAGQLAYAENQTQVPQTFTNTPVNNPGCIIVVPPTTQDVWLDWGCNLALTVAQTGNGGWVATAIYDVTSTPSIIDIAATHVNSGQATTPLLATHYKQIVLGPVTTTRVFQLYGLTNVDSGSVNPTAQFINYPGFERSFIGAFTR